MSESGRSVRGSRRQSRASSVGPAGGSRRSAHGGDDVSGGGRQSGGVAVGGADVRSGPQSAADASAVSEEQMMEERRAAFTEHRPQEPKSMFGSNGFDLFPGMGKVNTAGFDVTKDGNYTVSRCIHFENAALESVASQAVTATVAVSATEKNTFLMYFRLFVAIHGSRDANDGLSVVDNMGGIHVMFSGIPGFVSAVTLKTMLAEFMPSRYLATRATEVYQAIMILKATEPDSRILNAFRVRALKYGIAGYEQVAYSQSIYAVGPNRREQEMALLYRSNAIASNDPNATFGSMDKAIGRK